MGRGYWIPANCENCFACDGYYIDGNAVYNNGFEEGWNELLDFLWLKIEALNMGFERICDWESSSTGTNQFVVAKSDDTEIIVEDASGYVAVYVVIEHCRDKRIGKLNFQKCIDRLKAVLVAKYPDSITHRLNSCHVEKIG